MPRKPSPDQLSLHLLDNARRAVHALREATPPRPDPVPEGNRPVAGRLNGWDGCHALHVRCGYVLASLESLSEEIERATNPALRDDDDPGPGPDAGAWPRLAPGTVAGRSPMTPPLRKKLRPSRPPPEPEPWSVWTEAKARAILEAFGSFVGNAANATPRRLAPRRSRGDDRRSFPPRFIHSGRHPGARLRDQARPSAMPI